MRNMTISIVWKHEVSFMKTISFGTVALILIELLFQSYIIISKRVSIPGLGLDRTRTVLIFCASADCLRVSYEMNTHRQARGSATNPRIIVFCDCNIGN